MDSPGGSTAAQNTHLATVHDMLLLLYDWHSNLGCHDTSDFQRLGKPCVSGTLHVSPGVTLLHFMLSHQVMAKLTKAGVTPFSHFASHILPWGAASVINQPNPMAAHSSCIPGGKDPGYLQVGEHGVSICGTWCP